MKILAQKKNVKYVPSSLHPHPSSSSLLPSRSDHHVFCLAPFPALLALPTAAFSTVIAKRKVTAEELLARAESNGYKRGAYQEKDSTRDENRHIDKTKKDQNTALDRYVL